MLTQKCYASCKVLSLHVDKLCLLSALRDSQSVSTFISRGRTAVTCTRFEEDEVLFEFEFGCSERGGGGTIFAPFPPEVCVSMYQADGFSTRRPQFDLRSPCLTFVECGALRSAGDHSKLVHRPRGRRSIFP
jgi:hypothetical protein